MRSFSSLSLSLTHFAEGAWWVGEEHSITINSY